jgi:hypothetical protein
MNRLADLANRPGLLLALVVAGALAVRLVLMAGGLNRLDDPDHYLTLARSLAEGRGFALDGRPTAYRPPLYPILLAPFVATLSREALPWGVGAVHLVLGAGAATRMGLSTRRALVAAAVVAFDPVLAVQGRSVMTETLAAFLVAATLAAIARPGVRGSIFGGVGLGLACLCRPSFLPAAVLIALAGLVVGPGVMKTRLARSCLLILATGLILAPWAWRNARRIGEPVWTTTHGGYTLALANNPIYYAEVLDGPPGAVWSGPNQAAWFDEVGRATAGMSEPDADRAMRSAAFGMLRDRPGDFARASAARLGRFWGLAPSGAVYPWWLRLGSAAWTAPLWLALAWGLASPTSWRWPGVVATAFLAALTAVHCVYWTDQRMRAPLVSAIALIAVGGRSARGVVARGNGSDLTETQASISPRR